jgi:seryl-tRNA synthetase
MLTIQFIRDHRETIADRLRVKKFNQPEIIPSILARDDERRRLQVETNNLQAELNRLSREIGILFQKGDRQKAAALRQQSVSIKQQVEQFENRLQQASDELIELLVQVPNVPHPSVPEGNTSEDNRLIRQGGEVPKLPEHSLSHWELGAKFGLIDFELGVKITGGGFPVFRGKGARLQRALIAWFLDRNTEAGYLEIMPPLLVNEASGFGTGQLPDKEGQMYHVASDNLYLIPTAEVPVTNLYRDMILDEEDLPVKNTAYTPCFRREAGSYGKDVRGLNRVHQFDKVEIVQIQHPSRSYETLEEMVNHVEQLVIALELPYRIMQLCGGDLGFTSALTYDFEVYAAAQDKWLEVSSVSNFESYQANRLKLRFRETGGKKTRLAHTLNGSALALPRIVAALLENNQTPDGIRIPEVLRPYTGFDLI